MKNKKILLYYFLEFILTILTFITIILLILKTTILNNTYLKNKLMEINYYDELYLDIKNDFDNYIMQSGFDISIVDNLFTKDDLKKIINNNVDNFYRGKKIEVDTSNIKNKLENNIDNYLNSNNIRVNDKSNVDLFVKEITNIYRDRILINEKFANLSSKFYQINNLINVSIIGLLVIEMLLFIITKFIFKKITLTIPILSSTLLLILFYFLILKKINIEYIIFWNSYISNLIKNIFFDILTIVKYLVIIGIVVEIVKLIIIGVKKSSKN